MFCEYDSSWTYSLLFFLIMICVSRDGMSNDRENDILNVDKHLISFNILPSLMLHIVHLVACYLGMHLQKSLNPKYSRFSLSWLRLSRITAYNLKVKMRSLFSTWKSNNTWQNVEKGRFLLFHNIYNIFLTSEAKVHMHLWDVIVRFTLPSILQIWHVVERISRSISESPLQIEIKRIGCIRILYLLPNFL